MKINAFVAVLATLLAINTMQAQTTKVSGKISGSSPCEKIVVNAVDGNKLVPLQTVVPDNGAYSFEIDNANKNLLLLQFQPSGLTSYAIFEPKAKIVVDYNLGQTVLISNVKSSDEMLLYKKFLDINEPVEALNREYQTANDARRREIQNAFETMVPATFDQIEKLLRDNKSRLFSALLVTFFENQFDTYAPLYVEVRDALIKDYPNDQTVKYIDQKVKSVMLPGTPAPDIEMKSPEGKTLKLSDLRGKVVLLDFWASWCRPCRNENPNVVKLYHKYKSMGFDIFSVSLDRDRNSWTQAIKSDGLVWPNHVSDLNGWTSSGGATYGITSIPATVLIDKDGKVIARNLRGTDLENKLKEIFGK
ncbi:MAG: TlpA family protein disulfide reductase [Bacteroidales bacterium]|nr:TlpA family protein disulfide reductase [Bacteroidales bacterium]